MALGEILTKIPWKDILTKGPTLVDAGRRLYDSVKKEPPKIQKSPDNKNEISDTLKSLRREVEELRDTNMKQAEIISSLTVQVQEISNALSVVSSRMYVFLGISFVSLLVSMVLIFKTIFS